MIPVRTVLPYTKPHIEVVVGYRVLPVWMFLNSANRDEGKKLNTVCVSYLALENFGVSQGETTG